MHKGYLIGSVVLFVLSITCIVVTFIEVVQLKYGMGFLHFWCAVTFHFVVAIIASLLLYKAHGVNQETGKGEQL